MATGIFAQPGANGNTPPTAMPQTVDTDQDTPAEIFLEATDPDVGQPMIFRIEAMPLHGWLEDKVAGLPIPAPQTIQGNHVKYNPDAGYTGPDSFDFSVDDGLAGSNIATVDINVVAPPFALNKVYVYSVKVTCTPHLGKPSTALAPGKYKTAVNVLNPWNKPTNIKKWLTLSPPQGQTSISGNVIEEIMEPQSAFDVDCIHMEKDFGLPIGAKVPGGKGFLSIRANHALDVVAVYTSTKQLKVRPALGSVKIPVGITNNLDVEYIRPIVIELHDPAISSFHDTGLSSDHDGATSGRIHDTAVSTFHEAGFSSDHNGATSGPIILGPQALFSITYQADRPSEPSGQTLLRVIDPTNASTVSAIPVTYAGRTVKGGAGLATDPLTGQLYALLRVGGHERDLVTIDPTTGVATDNGQTAEIFKGLEFDAGGKIFTVSNGSFSTVLPETLYTLGSLQEPVCGLGGDDRGEVLAFNTDDGFLYHASGFDFSTFQRIIDASVDPCVTEVIGTSGAGISYPWGMTYWKAVGDFLVADKNSDLFRLSPGGVQTLIGSLDHSSHGLTFGPAPVHDSAVSDFHIAAVSPNHDGFTSSHDTAVSDFHITELSSDHDSFTSGRFHEGSVSAFHSLYFSSVHDGFSNFLPIHDSVTTGIHDGSASVIHDGEFSFNHETLASRYHDSAFTGYHNKNFSFVFDHVATSSHHNNTTTAHHDGVTSDFHDGVLSFSHDLSTSAFHDGSLSELHEGSTSAFHDVVTSDFHDGLLSYLHDLLSSAFHDGVTSLNHNGFTSAFHDGVSSSPPIDHDGVLSVFHDSLVSDFHLLDISDNHDGVTSFAIAHDTLVSEFHLGDISEAHDGFLSFRFDHDSGVSEFHFADISPNHDGLFSVSTHDTSLSTFHEINFSSDHDGVFTDLHDSLVSEFHLADISPNHDGFQSFAIGHDPSLSFFHFDFLSSEHDGFISEPAFGATAEREERVGGPGQRVRPRRNPNR